MFKSNGIPIIGFADADWATDTFDRKSVSGYVFKVYGCTVSWSSTKQSTVSTSLSEAEYVALSSAVKETLWLKGILNDLREIHNEPVTTYEDNHVCIGMPNNLENKRMEHIDIKHHFIRDNVEKGEIRIVPIDTRERLAESLDVVRVYMTRGGVEV